MALLTTSPHLRIRRPSPTTAEFIVSTRPPPSIARVLALIAIYGLRTLLTLTIAFILFVLYGGDPETKSSLSVLTATYPALSTLAKSPFAASLVTLLAPLPSWSVLAAGAALLFICIRPPRWLLPAAEEESVLVLRGLGVQLQTEGRRKRFIPTEKIRDVLINEAFRGFEVRYYLLVIVEGEEDVVVVFPRLLPRLEVVEKVWREVRACLYERKKGDVLGVDEDKG